MTKTTKGAKAPVRASKKTAGDNPGLPADRAHAVRVELGHDLLIKFYRRGKPWTLAALMPLVESCGLVALTEETVAPQGTDPWWCHEVLCEMPFPQPGKDELAALLAVLDACMAGELESDSLNRLALAAALGPRELTVWRAWVAYLQQIDARLGSWQMRRIVRARADLARALWRLFAVRHEPGLADTKRDEIASELSYFLDREMAAMPSAEHERVWRILLGVVEATLRTNVWSVAGSSEALAFKLDSWAVPAMPSPKPWREIFVYHPHVEGVHLRGGPVARGGLRHSTRELDYRTEVLGLMTAQMRKNTIIIPVGAKGGFCVRGLEVTADSIAGCYRKYVRALLSVTDTHDSTGKVCHPVGMVCRDGDDTYLVVAADKGTAHLSDTANDEALKADYWGLTGKGEKPAGFWLGDAFASGGSHGYDHKDMAITARGAWVSVMHHAGALGILPSAQRPLTMVGIGDMGGDVFGNGLLREPHVQLVGAFNHMHIFLDPTPDPLAAYEERRRLFAEGLGWDGYDSSKISSGGGVWPRSAKVIPLSDAVQERLGLRVKQAAPAEVIQAMLRAPVDCIWNGGIGTYIKASTEPQAAAADKVNDDLRVDADSVRARMIGEGGNLGITPRGRVELALRGVMLNTDALDNSGGVSTSDHEVNLKILLQAVMNDGKLDSAGRNKLLEAMREDVAALVLADNTLQNLAITLEGEESEAYHRELLEWQNVMVKAGHASLHDDCLPAAKDLTARTALPGGARYTRPELCGLMAATKGWLRDELLADRGLLECEAVQPLLVRYFPQVIQDKYAAWIVRHPLAREIAATGLANLLVNRLGILTIPRLMDDFETGACDAARACTVATSVARMPPMWNQLDGMPLPHATLVQVSQRLKMVAGMMAAWILRHGQPVEVARWLKRLHGPVAEIIALLPHVLAGKNDMLRWQREWLSMGLPEAFAGRMAMLSPLVIAPDVVLACERTRQPLEKILVMHLQVGEALRLPAVVRKIRSIEVSDTWARQGIQAMMQELFLRQRKLTQGLVRSGTDVAVWSANDDGRLARYHALVREIQRERAMSVAMLSVLIGRLRELEN
ncbi:MAG: hypothetical protein GC129_00885 [Proteobacteria bacterium]|nr:hypothetical protein [Pseudomonadota bacterium]